MELIDKDSKNGSIPFPLGQISVWVAPRAFPCYVAILIYTTLVAVKSQDIKIDPEVIHLFVKVLYCINIIGALAGLSALFIESQLRFHAVPGMVLNLLLVILIALIFYVLPIRLF